MLQDNDDYSTEEAGAGNNNMDVLNPSQYFLRSQQFLGWSRNPRRFMKLESFTVFKNSPLFFPALSQINPVFDLLTDLRIN